MSGLYKFRYYRETSRTGMVARITCGAANAAVIKLSAGSSLRGSIQLVELISAAALDRRLPLMTILSEDDNNFLTIVSAVRAAEESREPKIVLPALVSGVSPAGGSFMLTGNVAVCSANKVYGLMWRVGETLPNLSVALNISEGI